MANSVVTKQFLRALNYWPKDLLRPHISFQDTMRQRIEKRSLPSAQQVKSESSSKVGGTAASATDTVSPSDKAELEQAFALYSMLENRYSQKYPLSEAFMRPASNPSHYYDLMADMEAAPQRSWLATRLNKWKGFLRFT
ncbi:MAG: hypothetical protein M1837_005210 [Sclerophora amabilis]|nr:MAG: hypothetical protein M1837_005210 [Sclerophora amabilis]